MNKQTFCKGAALVAGLVACVATSAHADVADGVSFHEEGSAAGITSTYDGEWQYMVGGGAAIFDCNNDGLADLFLAGGESPAHLYRNTSKRGGAIRFRDKTPKELRQKGVTGAYPLDIDSDGIMDLVVLRVGENRVMRGKGNCRFEKANAAWGFDGGDAWSTAFSATWEKGNRWPSLAVGNYINRAEEISPWGSCTDNWLHRPNDKGKGFAPPLALTPSYCTLSILFTDWNRSGQQDLRVSNDREYYEGGQEQMWRIRSGEAPRLYTDAEGWKYLRIWGMGIAASDVTGDGFPDYFMTSMADNKLQTLAEVPASGAPKPTFKDVAYPKGVTSHRPYTGGDLRPSTAWHAQFEDVNNDGLDDLFVAKGNVAEMPDFAAHDPNNLLMQQPDGKFIEAGARAGVASMAIARGGGLADFNMDGRMDLVVVNRWQKAQLWRNTSKDVGHWLGLRLKQAGANRDGIGAWIEVKRGDVTSHREITSGGGHVSGQNGWWHFGLAKDDKAEVRVLWPDGTAGEWQILDANGFYTLERGKTPVAWK